MNTPVDNKQFNFARIGGLDDRPSTKEEFLANLKSMCITNNIDLTSLADYFGAKDPNYFDYTKRKRLSFEELAPLRRLVLSERLKSAKFDKFYLFENRFLVHTQFPVFTAEIMSSDEAILSYPTEYILDFTSNHSLVVLDIHDHKSLVESNHLNGLIQEIEKVTDFKAKGYFTKGVEHIVSNFNNAPFKKMVKERLLNSPLLGAIGMVIGCRSSNSEWGRLFPHLKKGKVAAPDTRVLIRTDKSHLIHSYYYLGDSAISDYLKICSSNTKEVRNKFFESNGVIYHNSWPRFIGKKIEKLSDADEYSSTISDSDGNVYKITFFDYIENAQRQLLLSALGDRLFTNIRSKIATGKKKFKYDLVDIKKKMNLNNVDDLRIFQYINKMISKVNATKTAKEVGRIFDIKNVGSDVEITFNLRSDFDMSFMDKPFVSYGQHKLEKSSYSNTEETMLVSKMLTSINTSLLAKSGNAYLGDNFYEDNLIYGGFHY
ncbi:hypothetical protein [Halobacteriovorax sp. ZH2_bin.1]|uniref:hypothetical protein n=1 Tax=unclassified Halobacteriovorax TaxID=2639665 RepID=UPI003717EBE9